MRQSGRLRLQHVQLPGRDPQHVLRLTAVRRPRALPRRALPGGLRGHLGPGGDALLHGDGHHALQGRHGGQAEAMHPGGGLRAAHLGARPLPEAAARHPPAAALRALRSGADDGLRVAAPGGLPARHGALQAGPVLSGGGRRTLRAGGGGGGGAGRTGGTGHHLGAHPEQPGQGLQELHHGRLQDPAAPRAQAPRPGQHAGGHARGGAKRRREKGTPQGVPGLAAHLETVCDSVTNSSSFHLDVGGKCFR